MSPSYKSKSIFCHHVKFNSYKGMCWTAKEKISCFQNGQCIVFYFTLQDGFQKCRLQLEHAFFFSVEAPEGPHQHLEMMLISPVYIFFPYHVWSLTVPKLKYELLSLLNKAFVVLTMPITPASSHLALSIIPKAWNTWAES